MEPMQLTLRMPLINMDSKLSEIPEGWLKHIEPHIIRGPYLPCWVWDGRTDQMGRPQLVNKTKGWRGFSLRKHIVALFWVAPESIQVQTTCGLQNCVNPAHFVVMRSSAPRIKAKTRR